MAIDAKKIVKLNVNGKEYLGSYSDKEKTEFVGYPASQGAKELIRADNIGRLVKLTINPNVATIETPLDPMEVVELNSLIARMVEIKKIAIPTYENSLF